MAASPLVGYNTNVRHLGKLYHIQTEDSGSAHGHIFTHLFADGGRIIASKKTTYSQYLGTAKYPGVVKQLMRESHKAMFIALRDGLFDEDEAAGAKAMTALQIRLPDEAVEEEAAEPDVDALERAAEAKLAESAASSGRYQPTRSASPPSGPPGAPRPASAPPAPRPVSAPPTSPRPVSAPPPSRLPSRPAPTAPRAAARPNPLSESIFGGDLLSEKSLDEVILSYLAEDVDDA